MPGFFEIFEEVSLENRPDGCDIVRQRYLRKVAELRNAHVILYASDCIHNPGPGSAVNESDVHGLMIALHGLKPDRPLLLILHSPGGSPEAAEGIVDYLHHQFSSQQIHVVVPHLAMSAATMIACAANKIVMGKHSFLGPIDPQISIGTKLIPARAIIEEFESAMKNASQTGFLMRLQQYPIGQIQRFRDLEEMSKKLVKSWLARRMLVAHPEKEAEAEKIAQYLSDYDNFKSHGRKISSSTAKEKGLEVEMLEADSAFQDAVLSVFHAWDLTFRHTRAVKIIESYQGRRHIWHQRRQPQTNKSETHSADSA